MVEYVTPCGNTCTEEDLEKAFLVLNDTHFWENYEEYYKFRENLGFFMREITWQDLALGGQKISAIREYREGYPRCSLKDAIETVEAFIAENEKTM